MIVPDSLDIPILIAIIVGTFLAFALEWLPLDAVAMACLGSLLLFDLVTPAEAISGFGNPAVITVMMMFILSHGLLQTGLINRFGQYVTRLSGASFWPGAALLLVVAGVLSAFINNTAAMAIFMPVAIHLSKHFKISPSKILLPLSYVTIFGGTCTLVGTSTNLLVSSLSEQHGLAPLEVFEFLGLGAVLFVLGLAYVLVVPMRFLPSRAIISSLTRKYHLGAYLTEVRVPEESSLVGRTVLQEHISERFQLNVLEILRGKRTISVDLRNTPLEPGDILIVRGAMEEILSFKERYQLLLLTDIKLSDADLSDENNVLVEIQVQPRARLVGQTVREIDFRRTYGCFVLALNRTGELIREKLASIRLRPWDILLVFGPRHRVEALSGLEDFVPLQELELRLRRPRRWWIATLVIPVVVALAATGSMSILKASILGVVVMIATRSLSIYEVYKSINWSVIFLLAAIIPLGIAVEKTGLAGLLGAGMAELGGTYGALAVVALIYASTSLLSEIVSNNSTAVLMVPIAITSASTLNLGAKPFVMAVAFAASASFLTPMGYQTNAMVFAPGGYRFLDFLRVGTPLKLGFWAVSTLLIPVIWPFEAVGS